VAGPDNIVAVAGEHLSDLFFFLPEPYLPTVVLDIGQIFFATSLFAAMLAFHHTVARYALTVAREGVLPARLARTRDGVPVAASLAQSALAVVVLVIFAIAVWNPTTDLFFFGTVSGGLGVLVLMTIAAIAVIRFFRRGPLGETRWRRAIAPWISAVFLSLVLLVTIAFFGELLDTDNPAKIWSPILSFLLALVAGIIWGRKLRRERPDVFAVIGTGRPPLAPGETAPAVVTDGDPIPAPANLEQAQASPTSIKADDAQSDPAVADDGSPSLAEAEEGSSGQAEAGDTSTAPVKAEEASPGSLNADGASATPTEKSDATTAAPGLGEAPDVASGKTDLVGTPEAPSRPPTPRKRTSTRQGTRPPVTGPASSAATGPAGSAATGAVSPADTGAVPSAATGEPSANGVAETVPSTSQADPLPAETTPGAGSPPAGPVNETPSTGERPASASTGEGTPEGETATAAGGSGIPAGDAAANGPTGDGTPAGTSAVRGTAGGTPPVRGTTEGTAPVRGTTDGAQAASGPAEGDTAAPRARASRRPAPRQRRPQPSDTAATADPEASED
jgi:hypothetical protein